MTIPALALFSRGVRESFRSRTGQFQRLAVLAYVFLCLVAARHSSVVFGAPGLQLFSALLTIDLVLVSGLGLHYYSAAIVEEREAETLGLLRMTALSPVAILLGKGAARLFDTLVLLAVQVPFVALAVALGGVSTRQIVAAFVALGSYAVLLCGLGLFWSLVCRSGRGAAAATGGSILVLVFGPFVGANLMGIYAGLVSGVLMRGVFLVAADVFRWLQRFSPVQRVGEILRSGFSGTLFGWLESAGVIGGVVLFLAAWHLFDRFTRSGSSGGSAGESGRRKWVPRRLAVRVGRAWSQCPLAWKDFHFAYGGYVLAAIQLAAPVLVLSWLSHLNPGELRSVKSIGSVFLSVGILEVIVSVLMAASNLLAVEKRASTLGSLILLPVSTWDLLLRKALGGALTVVAPLLVLVLGTLLAPEVAVGVVGRVLAGMRSPSAFFMTCAVALNGVVLVLLTLHVSLRVRRGALLVAAGVLYVLQMLVTVTLMPAFAVSFGVYSTVHFVTALTLVLVLALTLPGQVERAAART